jgi:hypothetical protein
VEPYPIAPRCQIGTAHSAYTSSATPLGSGLSFSLQDNLLRKLNGKPGTYEANEEINILAIVEEIGRKLSAA